MKLPPDAQKFLDGPECPQILKVSKQLAGEIRFMPGPECKCSCKIKGSNQVVYRSPYRAVLLFDTFKPCDEAEDEPYLQKGVELRMVGQLTVRLTVCPRTQDPILIGRHHGTYTIHRYRPNEDITTGSYCGTDGVSPFEKEEKRCCSPGQGIGSFCGDGFNKLKGWSLAVSYRYYIRDLLPEGICKPRVLPIQMDLDGVLLGPCPEVRRKRKA